MPRGRKKCRAAFGGSVVPVAVSFDRRGRDASKQELGIMMAYALGNGGRNQRENERMRSPPAARRRTGRTKTIDRASTHETPAANPSKSPKPQPANRQHFYETAGSLSKFDHTDDSGSRKIAPARDRNQVLPEPCDLSKRGERDEHDSPTRMIT